MTRSPMLLEKLKRLVRGIVLWRFVRRPSKPMQSHEERQRFTELIAMHEAFFFIELPMRQAMLSMEIAARQHEAEMRRCEAQRKMAFENANYHEELMKLYKPNIADQRRSPE